MSKTTSDLSVGSIAPAFTLSDAAGNKVTLRDLVKEKKVVLIFYPGDMTPGCTMQLCAVRDDWKNFEQAGISVFGVNHANAVSHDKFAQKYHFPFPLLIDADLSVSEKYGAIKKIFRKTVIKRTVVGISTDGTIVYYRHGIPKNTDILKAFKS